MAKIDVKGLVIKRRGAKGEKIYCYWQPNAGERKAGWTPLSLGADIRAAQVACEKQNEKVLQWRDGGARPQKVKAFAKRGTMNQLIEHYSAARFIDPKRGGLKPASQSTYRSAMKIIAQWAGTELLEHITRARVRKLRDALLKPDADGLVKLPRANGTMAVLRTLLAYAIAEGFLPEDTKNPAIEQNVPGATPRHQIWSQPAIELFCQAAIEAGQPSMALAIHIGREVTQRESDIINLTLPSWTVIPRHKLHSEDWERLAEPEPDGTRTVRGIRLRQKKTNRWIEVPIVGDLRALIERAVIDAMKDGTTLIMRERAIPAQYRDARQFRLAIARDLRAAGAEPTAERVDQLYQEQLELRQWTSQRFQRAVAVFRDRAAELAREQGDEDLAVEIEDLEFRDMRRTGVVWLGELGIEDHLIATLTGHSLDKTKEILETYMPRTTKMAGRAIVLRLQRDPAKEPARKEEGKA